MRPRNKVGQALSPANRSVARRSLAAGALLLALAAGVLWGQQQPLFHSDTRLVVCHVTVMDKNGHLVTNLPQDAFTVYENNVVQPIKIFRKP